MKIASLLLLGCVAGGAFAAEAPLTFKALDTPPAAKSAQAGARRLTAPSFSETSVVRSADGTLRLDCKQKTNPKVLKQRAELRAQQAAQP